MHSERRASDDPLERRAIEAVRGGDPSAYDYLVQKYLRKTLSIVWGIVRNSHDAEDLAQEAFVKAYQRIAQFREGEPFGPWVYRIGTNLALDLMKHRRRVRSEEVDDALPSPDRTDRQAESHQAAALIDEAIESLPEQQKLVARLYLVEEFSHPEIAAVTGLSEGTVRSHLSLARRKLQEALRPLRGGEDR